MEGPMMKMKMKANDVKTKLLEETLMLGKIVGRRRGNKRMRL